ncbi:hypothetical protein K8I28_05115 [bacterium]|nr:hypothetical protein [bacterium]
MFLGWKIKRAIKRSKVEKGQLESIPGEGVFILFPPQPDGNDLLIPPLNTWLKSHSHQVTIFVHQGSEYLQEKMERCDKCVSFRDEELKKNGLPISELESRIPKIKFDQVLLLNPTYNLLTEYLFIVSQARIKASYWSEKREAYSDFTVQIEGSRSSKDSLKTLLNYLSNFS